MTRERCGRAGRPIPFAARIPGWGLAPIATLLPAALFTAALLPAAAAADGGLTRIPYDSLVAPPAGRLDWVGTATHSAGVLALDGIQQHDGLALAERFAGLIAGRQFGPDGGVHDHVTGTADAPLALVAGPAGHNLSLAPNDPHFGTTVLLPTGPGGPGEDTHGEGALAILFDTDQCAFGLRVFVDGLTATIPQVAAFGAVNVQVFTRDGTRIAEFRHNRRVGILRIAYRRDSGVADVAGILVQNIDPGGIALDELRFSDLCDPPVS